MNFYPLGKKGVNGTNNHLPIWFHQHGIQFLVSVKVTWVKVFRIVTEFRILADFPLKVSLKMLNSAGNNSFSDLGSVYL